MPICDGSASEEIGADSSQQREGKREDERKEVRLIVDLYVAKAGLSPDLLRSGTT